MKPSSIVPLVSLLLVVLSLAAHTVDAGRRRGKRGKQKQCVYRRKGDKGECNLETGNIEVEYRLKASRKRFDCPPTKTKIRRCPGCRYPKKASQFGNCVDGHRIKVVPLGPGSQPECPPKRTIVRKCRGRGKGGRKRKRGGCVYMNKEWSECDPLTQTRRREKVLVSGNSKSCLPKKLVTKKCPKACRYIKGEWSECDSVTNMKNRTLDPKPGSLPQCEATVQTKPCFVGAMSRPGKPTKCRYRHGEWSPCYLRTNTRTQVMTLRNGDPNLCQRTVKLTRKCKQACKFRQGEWSKCDRMTRLMTRVDALVKGNPSECESQRKITRKCRKAKCKYTLGAWSECDPETNARSRVKTLTADKSEKVGKCLKEVTISKPCVGKDGKVRCFFGAWQEFGPCTNGVMTKQRPLLQGGVECERRAVATRACGD